MFLTALAVSATVKETVVVVDAAMVVASPTIEEMVVAVSVMEFVVEAAIELPLMASVVFEESGVASSPQPVATADTLSP